MEQYIAKFHTSDNGFVNPKLSASIEKWADKVKEEDLASKYPSNLILAHSRYNKFLSKIMKDKCKIHLVVAPVNFMHNLPYQFCKDSDIIFGKYDIEDVS